MSGAQGDGSVRRPPEWPFGSDERPDPIELLRYVAELEKYKHATDPDSIAELERIRAELRGKLDEANPRPIAAELRRKLLRQTPRPTDNT